MKKRAWFLILLLLLVYSLWVSWPRSFQDVRGKYGAVEAPVQNCKTFLIGGGGPPTQDGGSVIFFGTEQLRSLFESHQYQRKLFSGIPAKGGTLIEEYDGCMAAYIAYWQGNTLWIAKNGGWVPYRPTELRLFTQEINKIINHQF